MRVPDESWNKEDYVTKVCERIEYLERKYDCEELTATLVILMADLNRIVDQIDI